MSSCGLFIDGHGAADVIIWPSPSDEVSDGKPRCGVVQSTTTEHTNELHKDFHTKEQSCSVPSSTRERIAHIYSY